MGFRILPRVVRNRCQSENVTSTAELEVQRRLYGSEISKPVVSRRPKGDRRAFEKQPFSARFQRLKCFVCLQIGVALVRSNMMSVLKLNSKGPDIVRHDGRFCPIGLYFFQGRRVGLDSISDSFGVDRSLIAPVRMKTGYAPQCSMRTIGQKKK
jgi:hypothetical protein